MARVLKYPANCYKCGKYCDPKIEKEEHKKDPFVRLSFLHRDYKDKKWKAHCYECYIKSKI